MLSGGVDGYDICCLGWVCESDREIARNLQPGEETADAASQRVTTGTRQSVYRNQQGVQDYQKDRRTQQDHNSPTEGQNTGVYSPQ